MNLIKILIIFTSFLLLLSCQSTVEREDDNVIYKDHGNKIKRELEKVLSRTQNLTNFKLTKITL